MPAYLARIRKILIDAEQEAVKVMIANDPTCGVLIRGTGGLRKVRFARQGGGKSGGTRVIYYDHNEEIPVFLITAFTKTRRDDLTAAQHNELAKIVKATIEAYAR